VRRPILLEEMMQMDINDRKDEGDEGDEGIKGK